MSAQIWEFWGTPSPCPGLSTFGWPPSPSPYLCGHKASIIWNIATCEQFTLKGKKNLIILILDVHICVFVLDNFDNSIPKDGVDHEVNVTHRHDWPNKNASVPISLSRKRKDFIFQPLWHKMKILCTAILPNYLNKFKYGSYNFFFQADVHIWLITTLAPVRICPLLSDPPPP